MIKEQLEKILETADTEIEIADIAEIVEQIRVKYLGKKGELTAILKQMGKLSAEERPVIGAFANNVREKIEAHIALRESIIRKLSMNRRLQSEKLDVTLPAEKITKIGKRHPISQISNQIQEVFVSMGFDVADGPEIECVFNNFDALNAAKTHPSRDMTDTFYITEDILLRTQTSPVQIRTMQKSAPPIRVIAPGRVYRCDEVDGTHSPMFHQLEGLVVDRGITMADLKGTLEMFAKSLFGEDALLRFRPHYFPFTEPSAEVDVSCFVCGGKGCRLCKNEGWIEILGAGMVHPNVLETCGIDSKEFTGFAFGLGLERIAMRKFNISDMRLLYENDVRFLGQF